MQVALSWEAGFLKGKDGTVVTVVWRISTSPVRDIASTVQNIQNRNM